MPPAVKEVMNAESVSDDKPLINDVVIKLATANGSGSQSANLILMRSMFTMGVPVSGRSLFPSNIEGLPTWFTIRANADGWLAQRAYADIFVAMNRATVEDDLAALPTNTMVVANETLNPFITRDDLIVYAVPFSKLAKDICPETRLRKKIANMIYVGVLAALLGIEMDEVYAAIRYQFGNKPKAVTLNEDGARVGFEWAQENLEPQNRYRIERADLTTGKIIIEGNEASALGLMFGGVSVLAWYPITPSSGVCESLTRLLKKYRHDKETGKATYAVVQAEDEIASIGMVLGASWNGARACTATSGPGISLMAEMAGLSYFAEIPAVIVNVQRMGPSTGLPTRNAQGDITSAYNLSHGDCNHVLLIPGNVEECYSFSMKALDLAEELQTLVFIMSDLDLGMNKWMADPFEPPTEPLARGKVLDAEDLEKLGTFERYQDVDGDGVGYRTLPGTHHPEAAYFTRGTGHTPKATYSEAAASWKANMDRLTRKFETARTLVPQPVIDQVPEAKIGLIAFGSSDGAVEEARHLLRERHETQTSYLRLRALPVNGQVEKFIAQYENVYVIEQNRDAQVARILKQEYPEHAAKLCSVLHYNGLPLNADAVVDQIVFQEVNGSSEG